MQSEVNFLFALGKAYEDRGDFERGWEYYRTGNEKQRAEVTYDPVQTETMNDRLDQRVSAASSSQSRARRRTRRIPRRSSSSACRARARRCSSRSSRATARSRERASCRTSAASPPGSTATARTASTIPEAVRELPPQIFRALGEDYLRYARHAPAQRHAALHRQDAEQLPERRLPVADPAEREDHRRAPSSARRVPELLSAALRQGPGVHLRPDGDRRVLPAVPAA